MPFKDRTHRIARFRLHVVSRRVRSTQRVCGSALLCALALTIACKVHAQSPLTALPADADSATAADCLPEQGGYLRARLKGAINSELDWGNAGTQCTGAVRPDGGVRMRFTHTLDAAGDRLVLIFGIAGLREGRPAKALPVNVTVIREGSGDFFSTQGDDKCLVDQVSQVPISGVPHRTRSYRVVVRGFCTEPARAVRGPGVVLISRFDYAGRIDYETEDATELTPTKAP
jgi:hypothetical protein